MWIGGAPATVTLFRRVGGARLAVKVDRPVERGETIAVRRADLPPPDTDHYYVFQLVGLEAVDNAGRSLGRIRDVLPGTANDNLELESGSLVPMIEDAVRSVDLEGGTVVLNPDFIL